MVFTFKMAGAGMIPFQVAIHIIVFMTTSFSTKTSLFVILEQPVYNIINIEIKCEKSILFSRIPMKQN